MVARQAHNLKVAGSSPAPATKSSAKPPWHHLYQTAAWKRLRQYQLSMQPLCEYCLVVEEITAATVVDHIKAHKGDIDLFHDPLNLQSLCKHHHDSAKQMIDAGKKVAIIGVDGYPIELEH